VLIRHTLFNLVGLGAPLAIAVVAIPLLVSGLGDARFGLLTLIWAVVSYFGLFDLGLGRALTLHLSQALATGRRDEVGPLVWTALAAMAALGVLAGVALAGVADWGIGRIRDVPDQGEAWRSALAMACAMPFIVLTTGLRGVLESTHAFGVINAIRLPMGVFTFVGPLAVLWLGDGGLDTMSWVLAAGRVVACVVHAHYAVRALPPQARTPRFDAGALRPLAASAGWLTVSNTVSPVMNYVDRFLIGTMISAGAVAHYATPHEMVTKLWVLPGALTAVLFPRFSGQIATGDAQARRTYRLSVLALAAVLVPLAVVLTVWARPLLSWWISPAFAAESAPVLQVLVWGMVATCVATIPFTVLQSAGNARLTALLHLAQLPFYLAALWGLLSAYGLVGAAAAWALRNAVDAALLFRFASPIMRGLGARPREALA
jgi:O-antigen/teichoic acid export membrane protein